MPRIKTSERLITPPATEPIDLATAKAALRFTSSAEDALITLWIAAARLHFEEQTGRQLIAATWEYALAEFPAGPLELPRPPFLALVTINDVAPNLAGYVLDAPTGPFATRAVLTPAAGAAWPATTPGLGAVRVCYKAGYGADATAVPDLVKAALLLLIGHFHQYRAETHEATAGALASLPLSAKIIMEAFRYSALPGHTPKALPW